MISWQILAYLQAILDASLLLLLNHPPTREILQRLLKAIKPLVQANLALQTLRGQLEPFAIAHREGNEAITSRKKNESTRERRRRQREDADIQTEA